ncbi:hypothetical protein P43SY_002762 [Pythium insidiosum]|uniref:Uncharacterized protein n=1 Tax=Pythium insidiosum TaxID=114742 RepID=A0AAD5MCZ2_PYTIN|nr:hypothetical protein P43SY_002762 [Pythium insidiosum]
MMPLRRLLALRPSRRVLAPLRRYSAEPPRATANSVSSLRSASPGTVRVRRGTDHAAKEVEMDTTIARIMGSDWGDRRKQPVSFAMRLYWGIFIVVLANGVYTYVTGRDETYVVEQVQKKVDERLGRVETNEFVVMAADQKRSTEAPATVKPDEAEEVKAPGKEDPDVKPATPAPAPAPSSDPRVAPVSLLSSSSPAAMPFFVAPTRQPTKADYEAQLQQLRARQAALREQLRRPSGTFQTTEQMQLEIQQIDYQKAQLKQVIRKL